MRAVLIGYEKTAEVDLATDSKGSAYKAISDAVGGLIEPFGALYGDEVTLYVNDDGIASGQAPNRAIYANSRRSGHATSRSSRGPRSGPATTGACERATSTPSCSARSWRWGSTRRRAATAASPTTSWRGCSRISGNARPWARTRGPRQRSSSRWPPGCASSAPRLSGPPTREPPRTPSDIAIRRARRAASHVFGPVSR